MENLPKIIILSDGAKTSTEIKEDILNKSGSQEVVKEIILSNGNLSGFVYKVIAKYFQVDLLLVPIVGTIDDIPKELSGIEGILVYFNANNKTFLQLIPKYVDFMEENNFEFGFFLSTELYDNEIDGITYEQVRKITTQFDCIELNVEEQNENNDNEQYDESNLNKTGYAELIQAIRNHLWTNVKADLDDADDGFDFELQSFENMCGVIQTFRQTTEKLSQNDRIIYATHIAKALNTLLDADEINEELGISSINQESKKL